MTQPKKRRSVNRESPVQFRAESELGQLVQGFASQHGLGLTEASKLLVALAVTELDRRYYDLVRQLAQAMGARDAFPHACGYLHTSLLAARRATGRPMQADPERAFFIFTTVADFLATKGLQIEQDPLRFLVAECPQLAESVHGREHGEGLQTSSEAIPSPATTSGSVSGGRDTKVRRKVRSMPKRFAQEPGEAQPPASEAQGEDPDPEPPPQPGRRRPQQA